jgi:hypothetical protein
MVSVGLPGAEGPVESIPVPSFRAAVKELRSLDGQPVTVHFLAHSEGSLGFGLGVVAGRLTFGDDEDLYLGNFVSKLLTRTRLTLGRAPFFGFLLVFDDGIPLAHVHFSARDFRGAEWNPDRDTLTLHLNGYDLLIQESLWGERMGDMPPLDD